LPRFNYPDKNDNDDSKDYLNETEKGLVYIVDELDDSPYVQK